MDRERAGQLVEAGMWLQLTGDLEGARRLFEQALVLDPGNTRARELVGAGRPVAARPQPVHHGMAPPRGAAPSAHVSPAPQQAHPPQHSFRPAPPGPSPAVRTPPMGMAMPRPQDPRSDTFRKPQPQEDASSTLDLDVTVEEPGSARPLDRPAVPEGPAWTTPAAPRPAASSPSPVWPPPAPPDAPTTTPFGRAPELAPVPSTVPSHATSAWDSASEPGVRISQVTPGLGDAMDLVADRPSVPVTSAPPGDVAVHSEVQALMRGARDLLELDDHSGAMELILKAQALSPNDPEVQTLRERSEDVLLAMYESRLGPMSALPRVVLKDDEIIWLNFDHRAGFVLAQIDGTVRFEDLFEVCGMSRIDTARILAQLVDEGVISTS